MKRVKTLVGDDGQTRIEITIRVNDRGSLMRHESERLVDGLADSTMLAISAARHTNIPQSRIRVR